MQYRPIPKFAYKYVMNENMCSVNEGF